MSEWWTYTLSDFLLFSPRTYDRLVELHNAAIWPAQIITVGLGLAILVLPGRTAGSGRIIASILAACWLFVAVAFHATRYATINWAAVYFAWAFGLEGALLIWAGAVRGALAFERPLGAAARAGLWIFLFALAVMPLVGPLLGKNWRQVEIFGVMPDPTAVGTLGLLLVATGRGRWMLFIVPVIWCAISGATVMAMKAPLAWIPPLSAVLVVSLAIRQGMARRRAG